LLSLENVITSTVGNEFQSASARVTS